VKAGGKQYKGAAFYQTTVGPAPLLLANAAALPGAKTSDAQLCVDGTLDPKKVTGAIVVRPQRSAQLLVRT
jgi:hypothetical protein